MEIFLSLVLKMPFEIVDIQVICWNIEEKGF